MKHRTTQLGVRKNPDSPRVHGLRLKVDSFSVQSQGAVETCVAPRSMQRGESSARSPAGKRPKCSVFIPEQLSAWRVVARCQGISVSDVGISTRVNWTVGCEWN